MLVGKYSSEDEDDNSGVTGTKNADIQNFSQTNDPDGCKSHNGMKSANSTISAIGSKGGRNSNVVSASAAVVSQIKGSEGSILPVIDPAPAVINETLGSGLQVGNTDPKSLAVSIVTDYKNPLRQPQGPANPFRKASFGQKNVITGFYEQHSIPDAAFDIQRRTFDKHGYAVDPSSAAVGTTAVIGDSANAEALMRQDADDIAPRDARRKTAEVKRTREKAGDSSILEGNGAFVGPWAKYQRIAEKIEASETDSGEDYISDEGASALAAESERSAERKPVSNEPLEKTTFCGRSMYDYQGRTYMHVPQDLNINLQKEPGEQECFVPKRCIKEWRAHPQGVSVIKFFPRSGHLLLSAGLDGKAKIWDCYHERELQRIYWGHKKAVEDVDFSPDGGRFLSCSFDKMIKLWDTETGAVISRFTTGKLPHCVRFNPTAEYGNEFLSGLSDKKIIQFDMRSGDIVQEYDHHLGPVNTVTFVDNDRRFMTTSDDKSLRVWDYGIPVPIKFIADPQMHSMPVVSMHPSGKHVACQSLDNQILVFAAEDKFRQNKRKVFKGHGCSGYAIGMDFSPDGRILCSGDAGGFACFWDWKTCKLMRKISAHEGPLISIAYHPQETSKIATAGAKDGIVKYWD